VSLPLEFCVKDNGPGVPEDLLPNLFDPFVTTKPTGSGLGLALVAKIVGDHGASSNVSPNRGRPRSAYCYPCSTAPSTSTRAIASTFRDAVACLTGPKMRNNNACR